MGDLVRIDPSDRPQPTLRDTDDFERVTVTREGFDGAELTPSAYAKGLALAMRETVVAPPDGSRGMRTVRIPIVGRREWLKLGRSA